jgi:hypothetical protein
MTTQRYIDLCRDLEAATDEADVDRLVGQLDDLYRLLTPDELRAVAAHFEAREPG